MNKNLELMNKFIKFKELKKKTKVLSRIKTKYNRRVGWIERLTYIYIYIDIYKMGFPGDSDGKGSICNVGDPGSIPVSGRLPWERNGYPFQYSCLENSMDKGLWWAKVHGVTESDTT